MMKTAKERVLEAIANHIDDYPDEKLDDFARELLELPARPQGNAPYGWLLPQNSDSGEMHISEKGLSLIKRWEGFRAKAYRDPVGIWTIGYGHIKGVRPGDYMTEPQALALLREEVKEYEEPVRRAVAVDLNQNQFDALVSFTYNVGAGAFSQSTLLGLLNQGRYKAAANQFLRWVKGGGRTLPGLVSRRQDERELFLS